MFTTLVNAVATSADLPPAQCEKEIWQSQAKTTGHSKHPELAECWQPAASVDGGGDSMSRYLNVLVALVVLVTVELSLRRRGETHSL